MANLTDTALVLSAILLSSALASSLDTFAPSATISEGCLCKGGGEKEVEADAGAELAGGVVAGVVAGAVAGAELVAAVGAEAGAAVGAGTGVEEPNFC